MSARTHTIRNLYFEKGGCSDMEQERKQKRENIAAGAVGAFLGSLVGVLCIVLIDQLGYVASISGLVMAVGALKGYELLGGRLSRMGAVISCVLILIMTYLAHQLTWAIAVAGVAEAGIFECFQAIPALLEAEALEGRIYWGNLALLYLFTLVGAVPTIISGLQGSDLPDLPRASAAAQGTEEVEAAFYPGNPKWMRPLRFSASLSMLLGLVPTVVLMFMAFGDDYAPSLILAGFGCLISSIVMMLIGLAHVQLAQNATFLMVRVNGMVWKVNLPLLNVSDTYRFTKKNGAIRAIRWDILSAEEQERARASILRAISLLSSGQVMPGSILSRAVMPLTDFQFIQEDSWRWLGRRGMYYTRQEQDIIVTETNVDTLEFREITLSLNGKLSVLEEGADYSVQPSGTKESWKQYVYTIPGKNFEKEGTYILTICSEDRAANVSDNHTKGKKIEFVVDKTSPSILLSGVEDGGRYRERSREVTLDIKDNVKTAEVKVEINGVECTYHASEVAREDGRIRLMVGNDRRWQNIRVTAYDAAGNKGQLETGRFLITPDLLVQFFMDKKLFYGSMGGMVVLWAGTWHILFRRKRLQRK